MDILVVDDDADCVTFVATVLQVRYPSLHISIARHGADALNRIKQDVPPFLVLTDCTMPVMGGVELREAIREAFGAGIRVVLVTGNHLDGYSGLDFDAVMAKPIDLQRLYAIVESSYPVHGQSDDRSNRAVAREE